MMNKLIVGAVIVLLVAAGVGAYLLMKSRIEEARK